MPLKVVSFAAFLTRGDPAGKDFDAIKFVSAVKGKSLRGYATVPVRGKNRRLEDENRGDAKNWFAQRAADYLRAARRHKVLLVPVPNSKCVSALPAPTTHVLASAIRKEIGDPALVCDLLRWKKEQPSAHKERGSRDPEALHERLMKLPAAKLLKDIEHVLVDDVMTSGGHLQACRAFLHDLGLRCDLAIVCGRTVHDPRADPFALVEEDVPDWELDPFG